MKLAWWKRLPEIRKDPWTSGRGFKSKPKPEPTGETLDIELDADAMKRLLAIRKRKARQ